jgi:thiamine biosynthesis lipoprotein
MLPVLQESKRIYDLSNGAYNPAIMPLVNVWGFGPDEGIAPDSTLIDSLLTFSDFKLVEFTYQKVWKKDPRVQLDFSASAKGYAVDVIGHFLLSKGIENYFVEIGGEVVCKGINAKKQPWRIGIINPESDLFDQSFIATVDVSDLAVATSANNFNYRVIDGVKYSHTIDPVTGYPITQSILSASIFANECMTADALATACMVMGIEKAIAMIENMPDVDALLIYSDENGQISHYVTDGIKQNINFVKQD